MVHVDGKLSPRGYDRRDHAPAGKFPAHVAAARRIEERKTGRKTNDYRYRPPWLFKLVTVLTRASRK